MRFLDFLFPPRVDEVALRDFSDDAFFSLLSPRLVPMTRPGTVALFPFSDARVRAVIHEAKYHGSERALRLLSSALADYVREADVPYGRAGPALVPVPLGKKRRFERGFNQVEEIVNGAMAELGEKWGGAVLPSLLERVRETASQVSLPRAAREENMREAFRAGAAAPARLYIVIDDVVTTGATLQAAIDALREAGANNILPLALAH
ncbi:TPA: ComF family protein [Candidatus Kaiserbacteria bacterium]|nr:MAG: Phosphoribosyltransferase [Parcubacteria group bacterium GW2011_GWA1_56_13]KKW45826.1 MAG: Phosphoribosyltransferase [Parcubacteria group bacterium GW2011_GWB1_57_6]HCR52647.1 ComF family protein [Candidatus Kaiserbacteria bacterium]